MRSALPLLAFVALTLAACGARVTVDGSSTTTSASGTGGAGSTTGTSGTGGDTSPVHTGHFQADCAPNDGPATLFMIDDIPGCTPLFPQVSLLEITVFGAELANLVDGGTVTISPDINGGAQGNSLTYGAGGATSITTVTSGTVTFSTFAADKSAAGVYDLTFMDGSHLKGAFGLGWCPGGGQCG